MTRAVTITRHSADDRQGPPHLSPFRDEDEGTRVAAALEMVAKRQHEITGLERLLANKHNTPATKRIIRERIAASKRNLVSWEDYLRDHAEQERRAVVHPTPVKPKRSHHRRTA